MNERQIAKAKDALLKDLIKKKYTHVGDYYKGRNKILKGFSVQEVRDIEKEFINKGFATKDDPVQLGLLKITDKGRDFINENGGYIEISAAREAVKKTRALTRLSLRLPILSLIVAVAALILGICNYHMHKEDLQLKHKTLQQVPIGKEIITAQSPLQTDSQNLKNNP